MSLERNNGHVAQGLGHRIEQQKNKPKIESLLVGYLSQIQDVETAAIDLMDVTIANAQGQHLDGLGSIVGEERFGRNDDDYRLAISARIQLNLSNGTTEDVIALIRAIIGGVGVRIVEYQPAAFIADILDPIDPAVIDIERLASLVKSARPAGVNSVIIVRVAGAFVFDSGPGYDLGKYAGAF